MTTRNLDKLFRPRRIALIGAADEPHNLGLRVLKNILNAEFKGVLYPVDSKHEAIQGIPTFADLASLPKTPDLALVCTPPDSVPSVVETCGNAGVRGVLIFSAGFREIGAVGRTLERRIAEVASKFEGLRIMGPNSLGVIAPRHGLNASDAITCPKPGHLAFVSQSRALCNSVMDWADEQGIGFSFFVSIGNMLDIGFGDLIDYFNRDPDTRAIILYLQSIEHARSFMSAARAFARVKPIVAYKAGRFTASAAAAASHTGMMVAEDAVYDAAFERAGVVRVEELDDVFDAAELLASKRFPQGPRLAVVSNAGGPAVVATDALLARHGSLAELDRDTLARLEAILPHFGSAKNPVDLLENASPTLYSRAIPIVCKDRNVDAVLVIFAAESSSDPLATAKVVADVAEQSAKPVLAAWMGGKRVRAGLQLLNKAGVAAHSTPEQAIRAFMHLVSYSRNLKTLYETPRSIPVRFNLNRNKLRKKLAPLFKKHPGYLTEDEAKTFLKAYDIPVVTGAMAQSPAEAVELAERIGYPIVVKVISPDIVHRVEVGGVALNIDNGNQVYSACRQILQAVKSQRPDAKIKGIAVQQMLDRHNGLELILGAKKDPTFGTVIMVGSGGVTTEVLQDRALGLPPLNERLARRMLESLRAWPILQGYRGKPAANLERLIEIIIRFSCLITDYPEIREFDVNPLLVTSEGVVALDAGVFLETEVDSHSIDPYHHLAIRPYPEGYVRHSTLKDGTAVTLRPVKPEDEPLWHELMATSSRQSIHSRFRSFFEKTTHQMAVQYCVIDYEREMAIVAQSDVDGQPKLIGVANLLADANHEEAEFAVIIADPWQGKGLGGKLLDYCLELAARWGIKHIVAETEPTNKLMLAVFRSRGFRSEVCYDDSTVYLEKNVNGVRPH